ncbi:50S ribosomal protein L17 [Nautilia sp. PV-1]|jgi:large subunit ribosomal protein L17|uniref:50S ribosomal protein L17 n=1 Tax=Nautilia sp. PV-1 TaxID=2579250 RepID=UPI000FD7DF83|nr:50S ribosomal protein L17 [Nautilia sp. PV-1]AZV47356.1 50S ribosomal protein L17 [Nautilia sp. PV-1]
MRHKHGYRKLGRVSEHRLALLKNLACDLIENEKIETTVPKAKELRKYIERIITRAKKADFNTHRHVYSKLGSNERAKAATRKVIEEIAPKFENRNGGYTRIIKTRFRRGDAAEMCIIEFVGE